MHLSCKRNPFTIHTEKCFLHVSEQVSRTSEGECHGPDLPKDMVPFFDADPPLVGGGENVSLRQAAWWVGSHSDMLTVSIIQLSST